MPPKRRASSLAMSGEDCAKPSPASKKAKGSPFASSKATSQVVGIVKKLFVKSQKGGPMKGQARLRLVTENGIDGNAGTSQAEFVPSAEGTEKKSSASVWTLSPRQVLISSVADLKALGLEPGDLRENVVLDLHAQGGNSGSASSPSLSEVLPSGCEVHVGDAVLRVTFGCEPCGHVLDRMKSLCKKKSAYPSIKAMDGKRGILATVVRGGEVKEGADVKVLAAGTSTTLSNKNKNLKMIAPLIRFESFSDTPKDRFLAILAKVPRDKVITIKQLLTYSGAPPGYARALPAILRAVISGSSSSSENLKATPGRSRDACSRLVYASRELFRDDVVPGQRRSLEAGGVVVKKCSDLGIKAEKSEWAVAERALWSPTHSSLFLGRN